MAFGGSRPRFNLFTEEHQRVGILVKSGNYRITNSQMLLRTMPRPIRCIHLSCVMIQGRKLPFTSFKEQCWNCTV